MWRILDVYLNLEFSLDLKLNLGLISIGPSPVHGRIKKEMIPHKDKTGAVIVDRSIASCIYDLLVPGTNPRYGSLNRTPAF